MGFKVVDVNITWNRKTMSDYVNQFISQVDQSEEEIHTIGYSFGAVISFIASSKIKIKSQILCSLSPYFAEDLPGLKTSWKTWMGKKRLEDFESLKASEIAKKVSCKTVIMAGNKEGVEIEKRLMATSTDLKIKPHILDGCKHDAEQKEYKEFLEKFIRGFYK